MINLSIILDIQQLCSTHRVYGVDQFAGLAELHEALPQVVEGSLHKDFLLLVVVQQVVPQRLLGEGLGVPHDDHTIPSFTTHTRLLLRDVEMTCRISCKLSNYSGTSFCV